LIKKNDYFGGKHHLSAMREKRNAHRIFVGKPEGKRALGKLGR
jgi:hypothetical protein